jgi:flagellar hook-associated protein 3 FlgL
MSSIPSSTFRLTGQTQSNNLLGALSRTERELDQAQQQIATGKKVNQPSDAPWKVSLLQSLIRQLGARDQHDRNLQHASAVLNSADQSLSDASGLLIDARNIALDQSGIGSDAATRKAMAAVLDSQIQGMIEIANRQVGGVGLFSGALPEGGQAFVDFLGGVRYVGSMHDLTNDSGLSTNLSMNLNGADAFNLTSGAVLGSVNLQPLATDEVRLDDVAGALNRGIRRGTVMVNVDGTNISVDLRNAQTLQDIGIRINQAINAIDPLAGTLGLSGPGFELTANAGHSISITESGQGLTAADLGIDISATSSTVVGADIQVRLTELSSLTALGASVDFTAGLKITQGQITKTADFSNAKSVRDLINVIDQLGLGLELRVNADGTGLDVMNFVSGVNLSIGENGGSTAEALGIRTFSLSTRLDELNFGLGVESIPGEDDFEIRLKNGSSIRVNLDNVVTMADLIDTIEAATAGAGLAFGAGGDFHAALTSDGNGLLLSDGTTSGGGGGALEVVRLGISLAAEHLGISGKADPSGPGDIILSEDLAQQRVESSFTFLINLRDSLVNNESRGIAFAQDNLMSAIDQLGQSRATVALTAQRAEQEQERSAQVRISEESLLGDLRDADLTAVITRFTQLQTQLQATLQAGSLNLQLSLLDFLR